MPRFSGRLLEARWSHTRVEPEGVSSRNRSDTSEYSNRRKFIVLKFNVLVLHVFKDQENYLASSAPRH